MSNKEMSLFFPLKIDYLIGILKKNVNYKYNSLFKWPEPGV